MSKQRTLFWKKKPARAPKKNGSNPPVPERRHARLDPRELHIRFSSHTQTAYGGYPLWAAFMDSMGFDAAFAQHVKMPRGPLAFTAPELARFFVDSRVLGAARLFHVDPLRTDPLLTRTQGLDVLPSDETLGRYFKTYDERRLASLDRLSVRFNRVAWDRAKAQGHSAIRQGRIILDYDSSTSTAYGKQEGADRGRSFRKKDKPGFQTKFAFIGGLGLMAHHRLDPQSVNLNSGFEDFHKATLARLPQGARVWAIRGDGALYSRERVQWLEADGYTYAISATRTEHLLGAVAQVPEDAWVDDVDADGHRYSVARIRYRPATWDTERTYIISRRPKDLKGQEVLWDFLKYKYFAYVTNHRAPVMAQWKFCVERCSLENFIKEGKHGFQYAALPCRELVANQAYLLHVQMAYNLMLWWKLLHAPRGMNRWTIATVRERLLRVCGTLRRRAGRWVLSLPAPWPWASVFGALAESVGLSPT